MKRPLHLKRLDNAKFCLRMYAIYKNQKYIRLACLEIARAHIEHAQLEA